MNQFLDHAVQELSEWVRNNTAKGTPVCRFPLELGLIMANDGGRRAGLEDLVLMNYYPTAAFRRATEWKDIERVARGLIFEKGTGRLVARPFAKFFNYGELEEDAHIVDGDIERIDYKDDGSLGIVFFYNNEWWVTTHGSLGSDQGVKGTEILRKKDTSKLNPNYTYMTEIVYPANRIVTDYGDIEDLILLDIYPLDASTPVALAHHNYAKKNIFTYNVQRFNPIMFLRENMVEAILEFCQNQSDYNFEGFVVTLKNGRKVKFKTAEYLKVHRCRFDVSVSRVKDLMLNNPETLVQWKETLPNEFFDEVDRIVDAITKYTDEGLSIVIEKVNKIFEDKGISWNQSLKHVGKIIHVEVKREVPKHVLDAAWHYARGDDIQKVHKIIMKTYPV